MKKPDNKTVTAAKIVAGVAMTFMVAANVTGCGVYGPPKDDPSDSSRETQETTQVVDDFDPDDNMNGDVYGPPSG